MDVDAIAELGRKSQTSNLMMSHTQNRGYMEMFHTIINVRKIYPNGMATLKKYFRKFVRI